MQPQAGAQAGEAPWRADIDGLRALAVTAVVVFHAFPRILPGGFLGVDVFFVLSGYLITGLLLREIDAGPLRLGAFFARRVRRIVPALALVLASCWAAAWWILLPDEYAQLGRHLVAGAGFHANLALLSEVGYFDRSADTKPLLHLWSLAIEEQFYLVWPLVLWLASRLGPRMPWLLAGLALLSFLADATGRHLDPAATFYLPQARAWELLAGALLAVWQQRRPAKPRAPGSGSAWRTPLASGGLGLLLAGLAWPDLAGSGQALAALPSVAGTVMLLAAGPHAAVNRAIFSRPTWVRLGQLSYPLYLWHWPLLVGLRLLAGGEAPAGLRLLAIALALLLAMATWAWLEQPIRRRPASSGAVAALLGALALTGIAGGITQAGAGFPVRLPSLQAHAADLERAAEQPPACASDPSRACSARTAGLPQRILLVGDSHMHALLQGFVHLADAGVLGMDVRAAGRGGCAPFLDTETYTPRGVGYACHSLVDAALRAALADPQVRWVVLAGRHAARIEGTLFRHVADGPAAPAGWRFVYTGPEGTTEVPDQAFLRGLQVTVQALRAAGKQLVFVQQLPELDVDPRDCLRPLVAAWAQQLCTVGRDRVAQRQHSYRTVVDQVLSGQDDVVVYDPADLVCDLRQCRPFTPGGDLVYRDDNHASLTGARLMAAQLLAQMRSAGAAAAPVKP